MSLSSQRQSVNQLLATIQTDNNPGKWAPERSHAYYDPNNNEEYKVIQQTKNIIQQQPKRKDFFDAAYETDMVTGAVKPIVPLAATNEIKGKMKNYADNYSRISKVQIRLRRKLLKEGKVTDMDIQSEPLLKLFKI